MANRFRIPTYCQSPTGTVSPPDYRVLLIGINYTADENTSERGYRPLRGSVEGAKEVKEVLIELFDYKEEDICLMTDEEANENTALWPSQANIMQALRDLVRGARPGDAFIFFYAGHSGQQPATTDINEIDGLDKFIVTRDFEIILDNTLREYIVDPLPAGTRLTAILEACHSGTLLDLDHYFCHCFLPFRAACAVPISAFISERNQVGVGVGTSVPRLPCRISSCVDALSNVPLVISLSSCSDQKSTWEDSRGKSMTTKLVKILRKNPSINLGALNQRLQESLAKAAFDRVTQAHSGFNKFSAKLSPEVQNKWKDKFTEGGLFEPRDQRAQFGSLQSLCQKEVFIVRKGYTPGQQHNELIHPF